MSYILLLCSQNIPTLNGGDIGVWFQKCSRKLLHCVKADFFSTILFIIVGGIPLCIVGFLDTRNCGVSENSLNQMTSPYFHLELQKQNQGNLARDWHYLWEQNYTCQWYILAVIPFQDKICVIDWIPSRILYPWNCEISIQSTLYQMKIHLKLNKALTNIWYIAWFHNNSWNTVWGMCAWMSGLPCSGWLIVLCWVVRCLGWLSWVGNGRPPIQDDCWPGVGWCLHGAGSKWNEMMKWNSFLRII